MEFETTKLTNDLSLVSNG